MALLLGTSVLAWRANRNPWWYHGDYIHWQSKDYGNPPLRNATKKSLEDWERHRWMLVFGADRDGLGALISWPVYRYPKNFIRLNVSYWVAVPALAFLPGMWLFCVVRQGPRTRPGKCVKCGYDIRASKDRCPECGTPIPVNPVSGDSRVNH